MKVHWDQALGAAIEVAIGLAGFSGIVATVGRRDPGAWSFGDQIRLRVLLTASAVAGLFGFLPFVLFEAGLHPVHAWRVGSAAQALWIVSITLYRSRQTSLVGASRVFLLPNIVVFAGNLFNAAYLGSSWIYLVGVIYQLWVAFAAFVALLLASWRDETPTA